MTRQTPRLIAMPELRRRGAGMAALVLLAVPIAQAQAGGSHSTYVGLGPSIAESSNPSPSPAYGGFYVPVERYSASDPSFNRSFSPESGLTCFPAQQVCFNSNGTRADRATTRIYGN